MRTGREGGVGLREGAARGFAALLIVVHLGLGVWALVGFAELALTEVPWQRISNPLFSPAMLALQWSLVGLASAIYVTGYFRRFERTPQAMLGIYAAMAMTCAYQTFFILVHASRFREMAIEYLEYGVILWFLFHSEFMRRRFGHAGSGR